MDDPWQIQRAPSSVVQTYGKGSEYDAWLNNWESRMQAAQAAAAAAQQRPDFQQQAINLLTADAVKNATAQGIDPYGSGNAAGFGANAGSQAATNLWATGNTGNWLSQAQPINTAGLFSQSALDAFNALKQQSAAWRPTQYDFSPLNDEYAAKSGDALKYADAAKRNQSAYAQQMGGGYAGGIIDSSYSDPFGGQIASNPGGLGGLGGMQNDPSMPNVAMPWAQPWGTPGFGQPGQGSSQGVGSYNPGDGDTRTGNTGWGGPFGAKNPWSPA